MTAKPTYSGRTCRKCGLTERYASGQCVYCTRERSRTQFRSQQSRQEQYRKHKNGYILKGNVKFYGMTLGEYNALLEMQHFVCAICEHPEATPRRRLSIDHNHITNKIRGLLCLNCNRALGNFKDDLNILKAAVNYMETMDG